MKSTVSLSLHHLRCKIPSKSERHGELGSGGKGRQGGRGLLNRDKKESNFYFHHMCFHTQQSVL